MIDFWIHAALVAAEHAADEWTTAVGLRCGARELNPACEDWAHERRKMIATKVIGALGIITALWTSYQNSLGYFQQLAFLHHGFYLSVVLKNCWTLRSLKRNPYRYLYRKEVDGTLTLVACCDMEKDQRTGPITGMIRENKV